MVILFYQGNIEASIICHMQLCANKVTMYHFTHKAVGSHRSWPTCFKVSRFLQSSVHVHNLLFLFVKGDRGED